MKHPNHYLAIDPGDVHVGFATLLVDAKAGQLRLNTGVLHRPSRSFDRLVDDLVASIDDTLTVVESYQARAVGHQRFAAGETQQLIGAIRYAVERRGRTFTTIMPGSLKQDLRAMRIQPLLDFWIPHPRPQRWEHAFSAWRVLGRYLLGHRIELLQELTDQELDCDIKPDVASVYAKDLIASTYYIHR